MNRLASCSILALGALLLSACTTVDYDFSDVKKSGGSDRTAVRLGKGTALR